MGAFEGSLFPISVGAASARLRNNERYAAYETFMAN